jgi:hypothetical protein
MIFYKIKCLLKEKFQDFDKFFKENISENDLSKIMYYLNIVFSCINSNCDDIHRYTNYLNSSSLSSEDIQFIFYLSLSLSPDLFIGKIFFPDDQLNDDIKQKFYDIDQVPKQFLVLSSLIIEEHSFEIHKIFTFKQSWLDEYYLDPMNRLLRRFRPK